jgi:methyltransferase (TIGR00027 family)
MAEIQNGVTALVTAFARAYHSTHAKDKIFDDFIAPEFYTPEEVATFGQNLASLIGLIDPQFAATNPSPESALERVMETYQCPITLGRSRFCEDRLGEAISRGVAQYVILGAGFDTFAYRRPDLADRLIVFEVDHPATQAMKHQRLASLKREFPTNLRLVPVDFGHDDLAGSLKGAGYDPSKPAFFSWLGVTYYLSRATVFATLEQLAGISAPGSELVFDYFDTDAFDPERASRRMRIMHSIVQQVGEPMKAGFDPQKLQGELASTGWQLEENLSPEEIEARYFAGRSDGYHAFEHVHFGRCKLM